jgi:lysozyme
MKTSEKGIALIKEFEGLRLTAYFDGGGVLTIGYGHTYKVKKGEKITQEQATALLKSDLADSENAIRDLVKVPLNQNQFDALAAFVFNIGKPQFQTSSLLRYLNQKKYIAASNEFDKWIHDNGKVIKGLVRRRAAEKALFVS